MFIVLPPSETKTAGGAAAALDLDALLFPELRPARDALLHALAGLSRDLPAARIALGVTEAKDAEIAANTRLRRAPTLPALNRYSGVLYDALDAPTLRAAQRSRADSRILIASALFGLLRATDAIPAYRLPASTSLPGADSIAALWRRNLAPLLPDHLDGLVVDLRSNAYAAFGEVPGAISVRVVTEQPDGTRAVVSHFNKATKGRLARVLAATRSEPSTAADVSRLARRGGLTVETLGPTLLQIVT